MGIGMGIGIGIGIGIGMGMCGSDRHSGQQIVVVVVIETEPVALPPEAGQLGGAGGVVVALTASTDDCLVQ